MIKAERGGHSGHHDNCTHCLLSTQVTPELLLRTTPQRLKLNRKILMLLLLYPIFIVLFGCGRILFSMHCFSPLLILLGDIFSTHLYNLISAFFMRQIPLGMKHKRLGYIKDGSQNLLVPKS